MPVILSIETSTSVCSSALHEDGKLIASRETHVPQSAASQLAVQIHELSKESKVPLNDLAAVAVSSGPGSYTGLRIGVATAKGICFGSCVPLIAINSLLVLAARAKITGNHLLCPMIDARRMEVYCALFDSSLKTVEETAAKVISHDSFGDRLAQGPILFFGNGAAKCRKIISHHNAHFADDLYPAASHMGALAYQKFAAGEREDLVTFEPAYLKDFVAKTKSA